MNHIHLPNPPTQHAAQQAGGQFMPEEDDHAPEPAECQLADKFIDALTLGDGPVAAIALRGLKELDGEELKCLAWLFEDSHTVDRFFACLLHFKYRRRGRPKPQPSKDDSSTSEKKLIDALMRGNGAEAGAALRDMETLRGAALELMAQLLEDSPKLGPSFACRLVFRNRRVGRPYNLLRSGAKSFGRYIAVQRAKAALLAAEEPPRMKSAIFDAGKQTGCSRSTLFRAVKQHRPKSVNF